MKYIRIITILFFIGMLAIACTDTATVFVSSAGNKLGDGSWEKPFASIEEACIHIRGKRIDGDNRTYTISVRGGDYYSVVKLTDKDQWITIAPYENEKVRFFGGISIDPKTVVPVSGSGNEKLFPEKVVDNISMVSLNENGITNYGSLHPVGFGRPLEPVWMELFVNDEPFRLARWPNDAFIKMGEVIKTGSILAQGDSSDTGGEFKYKVDRPAKWTEADDLWLFGYFRNGWADDVLKVASVNTQRKTFTTATAHRYGFNAEKSVTRWYAFNIAQELDTLEEYYIDRKKGILYFYQQPEKIESLEVSVLDVPFFSMKGAANIRVKGIDFSCSRAAAIEMYGTEDCLFADCAFTNIGTYAIVIDNDDEKSLPSKNNGVVNCTIRNTGAGGIRLFGGDRQTLEAAGNYVANCFIADYNRIYKTYCPGIKIGGVGNRISHNEIFNSPHCAILLNGNDHLIEYNDIHDVCKATDDVGAFYYGRNPSERGNVLCYNYFHNIGTAGLRSSGIYHDDGACALTVVGNILYKAGAFPVLIGGGSDNTYINNIFIDDSIGIKVDNRFQAFEWAKPTIAPGGIIEQQLNNIHYNQPPYSTRYPELVNYWDEYPAFPKRNKIDGNVFVNVGKVILKVDEGVNADKPFLDFLDNNYITNEDPGFVDREKQNFALKDASIVFQKIPGFKPIPFDKIGVHE